MVMRVYRMALDVDRASRQANRGRGFNSDRDNDVLPGGDPAQDSTRVVGEEAFGCHLVGVLGPELLDTLESRADLDALHRVDAHHHLRDVGVEAVVERLAPARGHAGSDDGEARADRFAGLAELVHVRLELSHS
jgi:hypothetical protein